ncbi:MAG TPA: D-aminoacyl-tRNA deacylase [Acholeplasmataceae bacterium]|jgi:D-tyrosyl-tRNA(Tyr) deacylase|nr:D-aminoacyl-tRNA deacylase [Acholeplasmataceae bacterium]
MRAIIQRVREASVVVEEKIVGQIQQGYLIYLGVKVDDTKEIALKMAQKIHNLRVFEDGEGKMNLNLDQVKGSILLISQFTLYGDTKGNNRPSFILAGRPEIAEPLYEVVFQELSHDHHVEKGIFGANMKVHSINDGPVTIQIEI